jgi:hypothetical protein
MNPVVAGLINGFLVLILVCRLTWALADLVDRNVDYFKATFDFLVYCILSVVVLKALFDIIQSVGVK